MPRPTRALQKQYHRPLRVVQRVVCLAVGRTQWLLHKLEAQVTTIVEHG